MKDLVAIMLRLFRRRHEKPDGGGGHYEGEDAERRQAARRREAEHQRRVRGLELQAELISRHPIPKRGE